MPSVSQTPDIVLGSGVRHDLPVKDHGLVSSDLTVCQGMTEVQATYRDREGKWLTGGQSTVWIQKQAQGM